MKLTDADRATLVKAWNNVKPFWPIRENDVLTEPLVSVYLAGKRAGREDMRERAERAVMDKWTAPTEVILDGDTIDACAAAIRALGVDDD